jgi:hypothetical protein
LGGTLDYPPDDLEALSHSGRTSPEAGLPLYKVSAVTGEGVKELVAAMAARVLVEEPIAVSELPAAPPREEQ